MTTARVASTDRRQRDGSGRSIVPCSFTLMVAKPLRNDHCAQVDGGSSQSQTTPSANAALQQPQTSPPAAPVQTVPDIPSQATSSAWLVHAIASVGMVMNSDAEKSQLEH